MLSIYKFLSSFVKIVSAMKINGLTYCFLEIPEPPGGSCVFAFIWAGAPKAWTVGSAPECTLSKRVMNMGNLRMHILYIYMSSILKREIEGARCILQTGPAGSFERSRRNRTRSTVSCPFTEKRFVFVTAEGKNVGDMRERLALMNDGRNAQERKG
jgi:hypothetical protein